MDQLLMFDGAGGAETPADPETGVLSHYSASGVTSTIPGPLGWQADKGRTPAQALADAIARFREKYGIAATWAEVSLEDAGLTYDGVTVFPNRAVRPGTYRVGVEP